jgi:hypothetical protein
MSLMQFEEEMIETIKTLHLEESSLSRVWQHTEDPERSFAIFTAFRSEYTREENVKRNLSLAAEVKALGYGYFYIDGYSVENEGKPNEIRVREDSIFVVGPLGAEKYPKFLSDIEKLSSKYEQDWFLTKPAGGNQTMGHKKGQSFSLGTFSPNKTGEAYSRLRDGRTFRFESARTGLGWIGRMAHKS